MAKADKTYYLTSAIPYVNAKPHIGHSLEIVQANTIARFKELQGFDVTTLCGGDENALKNVQKAEEEGIPVQEYVDQNNQLFEELSEKLNAKYSVWQKGSDTKKHFPASQKLWKLCKDNEDIYSKSYVGLYCVGCETFYEQGELDENGECFEHPGKKLEEVSEENYFFKLSKYQNKINKLIEEDTIKIFPEKRKNEVLSFIREGLQDISISRSNERAKNWGVPVPDDSSQRMYVWFDALNIYQSGIGFGWDEETYESTWPADMHVIGKGIIRFHAVYWIAFLLSAKLKIPKAIFVHDYFTVNGQKMSKTLGNVIDPVDLIEKFGVDTLRYYFLAKFNPYSDGDFSEEKFVEVYNADLANGIGNLVARVSNMCEKSVESYGENEVDSFDVDVETAMENYRFDHALKRIWERIKESDTLINEREVWTLEGEEKREILQVLVNNIRQIAFDLKPFLPETSEKISKQFARSTIKKGKPLFPRI